MYNCPECSNEVNMIIEITTEQKSSFYHRLPSKISLAPKTSLNSSWVIWDKPIPWICPHCLRQGKNMENDCVHG